MQQHGISADNDLTRQTDFSAFAKVLQIVLEAELCSMHQLRRRAQALTAIGLESHANGLTHGCTATLLNLLGAPTLMSASTMNGIALEPLQRT